MNDITIIYITANKINDFFAENIRKELIKAAAGIPIISVSKKPLNFGVKNLCFPGKTCIYNEYKETYLGVREAKTKYVAIAEDDSLYTPAHFAHIPTPETFDYNIACWGIFTWVRPPTYNLKYRRNHNALVCERDLYIKAMEERLSKYPNEENSPPKFAEPGRYDHSLGVPIHKIGEFTSNPPIVRFSHTDDCYGFKAMGTLKGMADIKAFDIPYWGRADKLLEKIYGIS